MKKETENNVIEAIPNVDKPYGIVAGFLIFPALYTVLTLLNALIMLLFVNPTTLTGFDLNIYLLDVVFLPIILIVYFYWWKRKSILPFLMIGLLILLIIKGIIYIVGNVGFSWFNIVMNIVWIGYFLMSKRVKKTFIK